MKSAHPYFLDIAACCVPVTGQSERGALVGREWRKVHDGDRNPAVQKAAINHEWPVIVRAQRNGDIRKSMLQNRGADSRLLTGHESGSVRRLLIRSTRGWRQETARTAESPKR